MRQRTRSSSCRTGGHGSSGPSSIASNWNATRITTRDITGANTRSTTRPPRQPRGDHAMRTNISWAFAGNSAYAGCQWMVFVLLVRSLHLGEAGQFAYWIAVTGPVFILANVRLRNLVATDAGSSRDFSDYLKARLLTTAAAVAVALLIGARLSADHRAFAIAALIASARACDAISDICHGLFQRELDMRTAAIGLMINGILSVALVGVSLRMWPSLPAAAGMYAA